jgi:Tfp pilus assembly protein PilZ
VKNGGLFIPTNSNYRLGDEAFMLLNLMGEDEKAMSASPPNVSPTPSSASLIPSRLSGVSRVTAHLPLTMK